MVSRKASVWALWALCVAILVGCASTAQPQSTKQAIWASTQYAIAAAETANRLHDRGLIDDSMHNAVLDELEQASQSLSHARNLMEAGKPMEAEDRLTVTRDILESVQRTLREAQNE